MKSKTEKTDLQKKTSNLNYGYDRMDRKQLEYIKYLNQMIRMSTSSYSCTF